MGTLVFAVCKDCKVKRNLDKYTVCFKRPGTLNEAFEISDTLGDAQGVRSVLLASFMGQHYEHNCTLYYDSDWVKEFEEMPEDYDFWDSWKHWEE